MIKSCNDGVDVEVCACRRACVRLVMLVMLCCLVMHHLGRSLPDLTLPDAHSSILCTACMQVDQSGDPCFFGPQPCNGQGNDWPHNQFYIRNAAGAGTASVAARTYNFPWDKPSDFGPELCMLLPLTNVGIYQCRGNILTNLNPGDCNKDYPEARRYACPWVLQPC